MPVGKSKNYEYASLTPSRKRGAACGDHSTILPLSVPPSDEPEKAETTIPKTAQTDQPQNHEINLPLLPKRDKKAEKNEKDRELLSRDRWLVQNGHSLTYVGLFLFSIMVLFRPYEIVPGLEFLAPTAFYFALLTLAIFVPSQIVTEGNLTMLSTEVKAILAMTLIALATMPIARDPSMAWDLFSDTYIKAVVIFIVLVNVVRTRRRLMGMMWLSLGVAVYLGIATMKLFIEGKFSIEGYRVGITDFWGIFGNPNEMALHFVMMTPIVICLGIASKNKLMRVVYFAMAVLFVAANMVTYSRGGFLGLLATGLVLTWKLGRKRRLGISIASIILGAIAILAAPGNYGRRVISIFIPSLDPFGSADARLGGLITSIIVTIRNPLGIGIGNSSTFGAHNLETHNAFTQVSAELGVLGLAAYLVFILSPFRKLGAIERTLFDKNELNWFHYVAIGLQASIIGYMVSSFFSSVAYNWFIYYLIAYAVAFRRIYSRETDAENPAKTQSGWRPQVAEAI